MLTDTFGSPYNPPQGTDVLKTITSILGFGHKASFYYSLLIRHVNNKNTFALKVVWEKDSLGISFNEEEWDRIMGISKQIFRDIRTRLDLSSLLLDSK